jgi:hypothetical protein
MAVASGGRPRYAATPLLDGGASDATPLMHRAAAPARAEGLDPVGHSSEPMIRLGTSAPVVQPPLPSAMMALGLTPVTGMVGISAAAPLCFIFINNDDVRLRNKLMNMVGYFCLKTRTLYSYCYSTLIITY